MSQSVGASVAPDPPGSRWQRRSVLVLSLVLIIGLTGTLLAAVALHEAEQDRRAHALDQQSTIVVQAIANETRRYTTSLTDLAAAVGAQSRLGAVEFTAIAAPTNRQRLPGATGVSLVVAATDGQVASTQAFWRSHGVLGLVLRPAPKVDLHRFVVLSRSLDQEESLVGADVSVAGEAAEAMTTAEQSHQVATSRAYRLLRDARLPIERQQMSFAFAAPVYSTSPEAPDFGRFRGWLVLGLRGADFLHGIAASLVGDTVEVSLFDPASVEPVARWRPPVAVDLGAGKRVLTVAAPQRNWEVSVRPTEHIVPSAPVNLEVGAWLVGTVITLLLLALTANLLNSRNLALRRVYLATAALRDDIARREAVEQQLRRREAELVGFAGIVAHDLRNPLARVLGYADFLREEAAEALDSVQLDFLERLCGGAQRMQVLIDDLLDYATADNRDIAHVAVDLHGLAVEVVRERVDGGPLPPVVVVDALPMVEGDPTLLRQVLDNLIGNALKYTRPGQDPFVRVSGSSPVEGWARIEVADRGIGIPEQERVGVFAAFTRAGGSESYPGTGLGLAIVHRIVERHHGAIGIESNPDGGSTFWFTVPRSRTDSFRTPTVDLLFSSIGADQTELVNPDPDSMPLNVS